MYRVCIILRKIERILLQRLTAACKHSFVGSMGGVPPFHILSYAMLSSVDHYRNTSNLIVPLMPKRWPPCLSMPVSQALVIVGLFSVHRAYPRRSCFRFDSHAGCNL